MAAIHAQMQMKKTLEPTRPKPPRRRKQRKEFRERFKVFFDGIPDSDLEYLDEFELEPPEEVEFDE